MTTAAFGAGILCRTATTNRGELAWKRSQLSGARAGSAGATGNFGISTVGAEAAAWVRGRGQFGGLLEFGRTGCNWRGAIGAGMAGTGSIPCSAGGGDRPRFGGVIKSGRRIVCTPLVECGGLETNQLGPA